MVFLFSCKYENFTVPVHGSEVLNERATLVAPRALVYDSIGSSLSDSLFGIVGFGRMIETKRKMMYGLVYDLKDVSISCLLFLPMINQNKTRHQSQIG